MVKVLENLAFVNDIACAVAGTAELLTLKIPDQFDSETVDKNCGDVIEIVAPGLSKLNNYEDPERVQLQLNFGDVIQIKLSVQKVGFSKQKNIEFYNCWLVPQTSEFRKSILFTF